MISAFWVLCVRTGAYGSLHHMPAKVFMRLTNELS
ncbi:hypothetical protein SAMN05660900_01349, partial [Megasphaera cerevisiae DSM 20462]